MESVAARPIRLGCFDVRDRSVVIGDDSLPIAVEADGASGSVNRVFSWPLSPQHRGRPVALSILNLERSILIASPAAGGIVDIDRRSGQVTVIPLEADVGTLIDCGDAVWAVASPDWGADADERQQEGLRPASAPSCGKNRAKQRSRGSGTWPGTCASAARAWTMRVGTGEPPPIGGRPKATTRNCCLRLRCGVCTRVASPGSGLTWSSPSWLRPARGLLGYAGFPATRSSSMSPPMVLCPGAIPARSS